MNGTSTLSSPTESGIAPNFIANRTESRIQANNKTILKQFIHISALGIEDAVDSKYASSKINGENEI